MRLAREKPQARQVSDQYWLLQGEEVAQPLLRRPRPNARTERVKQLFDDLSQLSNLDTDPAGRGFGGRASFRDMAAFNFLPQHVVANPYTLFFKADTSQHREKLRSVMPLALGILTNEDLVKLHTRRLLKDELRRVEADLSLRREALERWRGNATVAFFHAQELSLLPSGPLPESLDEVIDILKQVVAAGGETVNATGRVSVAVDRLRDLRELERTSDRNISDGKRRLRRLRSLRGSVADYGEILADQKQRVRGVGWFKEAIVAHECILCGSDTGAAQRALAELEGPISELEDLIAGTTATPPVVDKEILDVETQLLKDEQVLVNLRRSRVAAEATVDAEHGRSQSLENVYRFLGSTQEALRMVGEVESEGGLREQAEDLRRRIAELDRALDQGRHDQRETDVHASISKGIVRFIDLLGIDGAGGTPSLDQRELNIKFQRAEGEKPDFLFEIGSGENWMAYHLAAMLSLHALFLKRGAQNPVPSFLVIDQPSQVYFPSDTYERLVAKDGGVDNSSRSKDLQRTRQIFQAVAHVQKALGGLQLIILDHADHSTWGDIENIEEVGNWRGEDALIPPSWLASNNADTDGVGGK
ncbi:MAG: hypothetical protein JWP26_875 [Devosia sp.]|uniref:DUF3732 domain-containing protein n=1 Tax=Devosia sp. TaxID=1871048 RepID=UPI00262C9373|nr:DUF3732 domain-containing protein [Devosia sp.]MDB5585905.1 hypothetical protein [Devosia sp.]